DRAEGRVPRPRGGRLTERPRRGPRVHRLRRDGRVHGRGRGTTRRAVVAPIRRGVPGPMEGPGRGDPPPRPPGPGGQVRVPSDGPERPEQARVRPGPCQRPDVRHPVPGREVRGPPWHRTRPPRDPNIRLAVPACQLATLCPSLPLAIVRTPELG